MTARTMLREIAANADSTSLVAAICDVLDACDDVEVTTSSFGCEVGAMNLAGVISARISENLQDGKQ